MILSARAHCTYTISYCSANTTGVNCIDRRRLAGPQVLVRWNERSVVGVIILVVRVDLTYSCYYDNYFTARSFVPLYMVKYICSVFCHVLMLTENSL